APVALLADDDAPHVTFVELADDGAELARTEVPAGGLAGAVARLEADRPRWVWDDTARRYPPLLAAGVHVERCWDLRLCHAILRNAAATSSSALATAPPGPWDGLEPGAPPEPEPTLFELPAPRRSRPRLDVLGALRSQLEAVATSSAPGRLRLLLAAESTGALLAA